jgi:hypothetical protein
MKRAQSQIPRRAYALLGNDKMGGRDGIPLKPFVADAAIFARVQRFLAIIGEMLREIFDEAAYSRYLARHSSAHSVETYRAFLHEAEQARDRRPRCC